MLYIHADIAYDAHRLVRRQDLRENLPRVQDGITYNA